MKPNHLLCLIAVVGVTATTLLRPTPGMAAAGFPYSTHIGGGNDDWASSLAVGPQGDIFLTGYTFSSNFPGAGAVSPKGADVLVMRLDPTGKQIRYSVLIGGAGDDRGLSIAVNGSNEVVVAVQSGSADFPMKNAAIGTRPANADNALFKLGATGALLWSTWLDLDLEDAFENGHVLALDPQGNAYVTGRVAVDVPDPDFPEFEFSDGRIGVEKFSGAGAPVYATSYGGPTRNVERGVALAVDGAGRAYVAAVSEDGSDDFPVSANPAQALCGARLSDPVARCDRDALIVVLAPDGQSVDYASYLGGGDTDLPKDIAIDAQHNIVIVGETHSRNFPVKSALQAAFPGDTSNARFANAFVTRISVAGDIVFSTYLGALDELASDSATSVAVDAGGNAHVSGLTGGAQFPVLNAAQPALGDGFCGLGGTVRRCYDGFVVSFSPAGALLMSTYLGGGLDDVAHELAIGVNGLVVAGFTESTNFPSTGDALQPVKAIKADMFLTRVGSGAAPTPTSSPTPNPALTWKVFVPLTSR